MIQNLIERKDYTLDQIFKKRVSILYMPRKTNTLKIEKHALGFKVVNRITLMFGSSPINHTYPNFPSDFRYSPATVPNNSLVSTLLMSTSTNKLPILLKTVSILIVLHACFLSHLIVSDSLRAHRL